MHRDQIFVAGGQPTVTYVERSDENIERDLARAIATPNQIVSLSGPTKTGKTVLCRKILGSRQFVWIDGGRFQNAEGFWDAVSSELGVYSETEEVDTSEVNVGVEGSVPFIATANGSLLASRAVTKKYKMDSLATVLQVMIEESITLVIDDFHYLAESARVEIMRNVKGAVFNGLKVLLLSATHRVFDAIKAEPELTGRFLSVTMPNWKKEDLVLIPHRGFKALGVRIEEGLVEKLCDEAQDNPFLMQRFCWEICFDLNIETPDMSGTLTIGGDYDTRQMFMRIARDAGMPIYEQLAAGPQSRKDRERRPLKQGGDVDIYQATLLAIAETGPKSSIKYEELRQNLVNLLEDRIPAKHEVTSALINLSKIARDMRADSAIDWDEETRDITVADPYLRFYLRWQIRGSHAP